MNAQERRRRFIRDQQLAGATLAEATAAWNTAIEIGDTFEHDGYRLPAPLDAATVDDAIDTWLAIRKAGL